MCKRPKGSCQISNSFARWIEVLRHLVIYGKGLAFRRLEDELLFLDNAETLLRTVQKRSM